MSIIYPPTIQPCLPTSIKYTTVMIESIIMGLFALKLITTALIVMLNFDMSLANRSIQ